jgi:hypothetical protein
VHLTDDRFDISTAMGRTIPLATEERPDIAVADESFATRALTSAGRAG